MSVMLPVWVLICSVHSLKPLVLLWSLEETQSSIPKDRLTFQLSFLFCASQQLESLLHWLSVHWLLKEKKSLKTLKSKTNWKNNWFTLQFCWFHWFGLFLHLPLETSFSSTTQEWDSAKQHSTCFHASFSVWLPVWSSVTSQKSWPVTHTSQSGNWQIRAEQEPPPTSFTVSLWVTFPQSSQSSACVFCVTMPTPLWVTTVLLWALWVCCPTYQSVSPLMVMDQSPTMLVVLLKWLNSIRLWEKEPMFSTLLVTPLLPSAKDSPLDLQLLSDSRFTVLSCIHATASDPWNKAKCHSMTRWSSLVSCSAPCYHTPSQPLQWNQSVSPLWVWLNRSVDKSEPTQVFLTELPYPITANALR